MTQRKKKAGGALVDVLIEALQAMTEGLGAVCRETNLIRARMGGLEASVEAALRSQPPATAPVAKKIPLVCPFCTTPGLGVLRRLDDDGAVIILRCLQCGAQSTTVTVKGAANPSRTEH
jgi:hypothetical protein